MIENGLIKIDDENLILYIHSLAIEGFPEKFQAGTVFVDIPNSYLKSFLKFFNAETFRFVQSGQIYNPFDWVELSKTNAIIIEFTTNENNKKRFRKILIKDQEKIGRIR